MKVIKFSLSLIITLGLVFFLNNNWTIKGIPIPPLGRFLDPFHGFWQNIEHKNFQGEEKLDIPGLQSPVTVVYDSLLIPHIYAQNENDLYFAQGYVTAMHRLWQMEFQIYGASGRISEIIGEVALDYDRKQRRLGMVFGAEHAVETMMKDPEINNVMTQYTNGVNAYITTLAADKLPFEYKLLNYKPEPWTNLKIGLLLKNLSQTLNIAENDLEMTNALKLYGKDVVDLLYFDSEKPTGDPIVSNPGGWNFQTLKLDSLPLALPDELIKLPATTEKKKGIGSNNWAVHGSKTASGYPIICNDPHLALSFPSIWFVAHLNAPGVNVMGGSLPGTPAIVIGFNDSIAWAETNAQRDLVDWYKIQFQDEKRNAYLTDGRWKQVLKKVEKILIRGKDPFYDTVIYTHHGPVVYDKSFHGENGKNGYSFRWLAHDGSEELKTLHNLNRGKNYDDYMKALEYWSGPAQNFAFASVQGDIAMRIQGKFPVRRKDEGKFVLDGTKTSTEWKVFIPNNQNVMIKNPLRGFVSSANQFPADSTYPYFIRTDWYETFRNRRINHVLTGLKNITPQDMMTLQNDNLNLQAAESLPLMLSMLNKTSLQSNEQKMIDVLTLWDYVNTTESMAATYYESWWNRLYYMMWDEMNAKDIALDFPNDFNTIYVMKHHPELSFYDIVSTSEKEDLKTIINLSFSAALAEIEEWEKKNSKPAQWADYKDTYVQHLLRIAPLSSHVRVGGNSGIINATTHRNGPSWRMIVSLDKSNLEAWGVYPGGQSGNPGSAYYNNMLDSWATGKYYRLNFTGSIDKLKEHSIFTTQLNPEKK